MLMLPVGGLRKTGHAHSYELNCQRPTIPARWGIVSHRSPLPREREPVTMHRPLVCCGGPTTCLWRSASNKASAASLLWRGLWPPWQVSEEPLPLRGQGGGGRSPGARTTRIPLFFKPSQRRGQGVLMKSGLERAKWPRVVARVFLSNAGGFLPGGEVLCERRVSSK